MVLPQVAPQPTSNTCRCCTPELVATATAWRLQKAARRFRWEGKGRRVTIACKQTRLLKGAAGRRSMHISKLTLINYRNFRNTTLRFQRGVNTIIGETTENTLKAELDRLK